MQHVQNVGPNLVMHCLCHATWYRICSDIMRALHSDMQASRPPYVYMTEFRQPLQVQSHLEMLRILVQLGHTQRT